MIGRCLILAVLTLASPNVLVAAWNPFRAAAKPRWALPFTQAGELGTELEGEFVNLLDSCQALTLDSRGTFSSIPPLLQKDVDIHTRIAQRYTSESTYNLFRYIFQRKDEKLPTTWIPSRLLSEDLFARFDLPRPEFGSGSIIHSQSCAAILEAAIRAKLRPPQSSFEGALSSQFQNHYDLAIVKGTFYSPLWSLLSRSSEASRRLFALLNVWRAYQDEPALATTPHYYLRGFRGVAVFQVGRQGRSSRASVKASVGGNWVLASLEASGQLDASATSQTQLIDYTTYVFSLPDGAGGYAEARNVEPLPDLNSIRAEFRKARLTYAAERQVLTAGVPHIHSFELDGVPATLCASSEWAAQMQPSDAKLRTTKPGPGTVQLLGAIRSGEDKCRFQVQYTADPLPEETTVSYWITGAAMPSSANSEPARLEVPVTFPLITTDLPRYEVLAYQKEPTVTAVGGVTSLRWSLPVTLRDEAVPLGDTTVAPTIEEVAFTCNTDVATPSAEYIGPLEGRAGAYQFALTTYLRAGQTANSAGPFKLCNVRIALGVTLKASRAKRIRNVHAELRLPVITETSVAPPVTTPSSQ